MNPNQSDNPLSDNYSGSKSQFVPKRPNPYFVPKTSGSPENKLSQSAVNPTFTPASEHKREGAPLFPPTTTYNNPFAMKASQNVQNSEVKPRNPIFGTSNLDASTASTNLSQSSIVSSSTAPTNPRTESAGDLANLQKRTQPLLFSQGLNIPVQQPAVPKKEPLRGIYAFFGSETLPPNQKKANTAELPQGLEAIPLIFKNHAYKQGVDTISNLIKKAANADEKMYFRIIRIICIMKLQMWDKVILEFAALGSLDKLIYEANPQVPLPYHLRLIFALFPYFSSQPAGKSHTAAVYTKTNEDKTIERLFSLIDYCEKHITSSPYPQPETYEAEAININSICDIKVSEQKWAARMIRTSLILLEILLARSSAKVAGELLNNILAKFPNNTSLLSYQARLHLLKGDYKDSASLFETVGQGLPQDEFLEIITFNSFLKSVHELDYAEATRLLNEMLEKFPQYKLLIKNNLFYIQFAECKIKEAMETLETFIKSEPWNMNDVVVHNLLLAYDFYYADSREKRRVIKEIIEHYGADISKEIYEKETKAS